MLRSLIFSAACGLSLAAQALPLVSLEDEPGKSDWKVHLGAMVLATPRAPGSDDTRVVPLPVISAEYKDKVYLGSSRVGVGLGGGIHALHSEHWTWDLGLGAGENRRESRSDTLAGMGDRGLSLFAGTALRMKAGILHGSFSVAAGLKDQAGLRSTLSLGLAGRLGGRWSGGLAASATARDAKGMAYDFGIDPAQAATRSALLASGDPRLRPGEDRVWSPKGGLQEAALGAHIGYAANLHWHWFGAVRAAALQGDAKDSPLTRRADSLTFGVGATYRF